MPEIDTTTQEPSDLPPPIVSEDENPEKPAKKPEAKGEKPKHYVPVSERGDSAVRRALANQENKTLREIIEAFGNEGSYKVEITRKEPQEAPDTSGKIVKADGFIKSFENPTKPIDEDYIQRNYGGGEYEVKFKERKANGTGWLFAGQRPVKIAGHPIIQAQLAPPSNAPQAPQGESPSIVAEAMKMANETAKRAEERAERSSSRSNSDDPVIKMLMEQNARLEARIDAQAKELRENANKRAEPAPENTFQQKLLDKLVDGDSARVLAVKTQYESEIAALRTAQIAEEKRIRDQAERDREELKRLHQNALDSAKQSYETQLSAAKSSFETQLSSAKSSFDTQQKLSDAENRRLAAENSELRVEVKELRAKKDKSVVEMAKEMKTIKEAFESDDEGGGSVGEKLAEAAMNPDTWNGLATLFRGPAPAAPAAPAPQAQAPQPKRKVIAVSADNEMGLAPGKYIQEVNGTLTGPLPENKKKKIAAGNGDPQMPTVDPAVMSSIVSILEVSFSNGQEPEIVAQGARSRVPEEVLVAIRDHGVDQVMAKMAKLSGTSPLSTQAGRNWLRKLGQALVGE